MKDPAEALKTAAGTMDLAAYKAYLAAEEGRILAKVEGNKKTEAETSPGLLG
jgi:hypothetical protein